MPVDPPVQRMLDLLASMQRPSMPSTSPEEARRGFRMLTVDARSAHSIVPVAAVEELELAGPACPLRARVYRPDADPPLATIVFIHGGGFVIGDVDTHDNQCRTLCAETGAVVLSTDYRLAPEAPFPAALEDALCATRWAAEQRGRPGRGPGPDRRGRRQRRRQPGRRRRAAAARHGPGAGRAAAHLSRDGLRRALPLGAGERRGVLPDARGHGLVRRPLRGRGRPGRPAPVAAPGPGPVRPAAGGGGHRRVRPAPRPGQRLCRRAGRGGRAGGEAQLPGPHPRLLRPRRAQPGLCRGGA